MTTSAFSHSRSAEDSASSCTSRGVSAGRTRSHPCGAPARGPALRTVAGSRPPQGPARAAATCEGSTRWRGWPPPLALRGRAAPRTSGAPVQTTITVECTCHQRVVTRTVRADQGDRAPTQPQPTHSRRDPHAFDLCRIIVVELERANPTASPTRTLTHTDRSGTFSVYCDTSGYGRF
jgi:hypothetical protein